MRPMKHMLGILLLAALAGCASSSSAPAQPRPQLEFAELVGSTNVQMVGPLDVKYGMRVTNPSTEPITLRRIEIRQIGTGAYQLVRNTPVIMDQTIAPGGSVEVAFWQHAFQRIAPADFGGSEPVTLRVVAFFNSPHGGFQEIKQVILGQFD